jgi:hypothetical protein
MALVWSLLIVVILALGGGAYEYFIGFPRLIDGKWVRRYTSWQTAGLGSPIVTGPSQIYYYYVDPQGREVRHGPFRNFHANGTVSRMGRYHHGEPDGTWTVWDQDGVIRGEKYWENGHLVKESAFPKVRTVDVPRAMKP